MNSKAPSAKTGPLLSAAGFKLKYFRRYQRPCENWSNARAAGSGTALVWSLLYLNAFFAEAGSLLSELVLNYAAFYGV